MLEIRQLFVRYGSKEVLGDLNLQWEAGQIHGFIGLNGSGKTTFFKALYQMIPYEGQVFWQGVPLQRKDMAWLETHNYFYHYITGAEYLQLLAPNDKPVLDLTPWTQLLDLPLDQLVDGYSTGMKKKIALLGLLQQRKPLLLLDEPFNGVDMESCRLFEMLFQGLKQKGYTLIITSHILDTLINTCDDAYLLQGGKIAQTFNKNQLADMDSHVFGKLEGQLQPLLEACLEGF